MVKAVQELESGIIAETVVRNQKSETMETIEAITTKYQSIDYCAALREYYKYGRHRSMRQFCNGGGYDYEKFCRYSCRGLKEAGIMVSSMEGSDARPSNFIPLEV